jgi:cytosine/adenosine deaminase-related metal-dependent hydrolase
LHVFVEWPRHLQVPQWLWERTWPEHIRVSLEKKLYARACRSAAQAR